MCVQTITSEWNYSDLDIWLHVYLETIQAKTDGQSQRSETELTGYHMNVLYECWQLNGKQKWSLETTMTKKYA